MKFSMSLLLALFLLFPLAAKTSAAPAPLELTARTQYSTDSDGVKTTSTKLSTENMDTPFTFSVYYNHLRQRYESSINEYVLLVKWKRPLSKQETLTLWAGVLSNDIRTFVPAAFMYDRAFSDKSHLWVSAGRENIGTIRANQLGLDRTNLSATFLHKPTDDTVWKLSGDQWYYNDANQEQKWKLGFTKRFSKRFDITAAYQYHNANFTRPGIYWVPQQEHAVTLAPRYMIPLGKESNLSLTFQQAVWARNKTGGINQYEIEVACNIGRLTAMYRQMHDGDYNSSNYSLEYKFRW